MNRDDIIRMALEAGFSDADNSGVWITDAYWDDELARFAALVAAAEREECAKLFEPEKSDWPEGYLQQAADVIRARG